MGLSMVVRGDRVGAVGRLWAVAVAVALVPAACDRSRSGILVRIETDLTVGATGEVKGLRLRVASGSGATGGWRLDNVYPMHLGAQGAYRFPFRALVMPLQDDATRIVTVEAWLCNTPTCPVEDQPIVLQRAIFGFVEGEQRELLMFMSDVCRGMRCANPTETCRGRVPGCRPALYDASQLPGVGQSSPEDAGVIPADVADSGLCSGRACLAGQRCCRGVCIDVESNRLQCGACDAPCGALQVCMGGRCVCPADTIPCLGDCLRIATSTDPANCGGCGIVCAGASVCREARCQCVDTGSMEAICGGVCVRRADNPDHCGMCGIQCAANMHCALGRCVCPSSETDCGGTCADRTRDALHCDRCETDCGDGMVCTDRMCIARPAMSSSRTCAGDMPACAPRVVPAAMVALGASGVPGAEPTQVGISVGGFRIDRAEVTVSRFRAWWADGHSGIGGRVLHYPGGVVLRVEGEVRAPVSSARNPACNWSLEATGRENHPINCVDWTTAQSFCAWDGGRLPTEAEWEAAARGAEGRLLPWGSATMLGAACVSDGVPPRTGTCAVDMMSFAADTTPEGVSGMLGNVAELTADVFEPYVNTRCWGGMARSNPLCVPAATGTPPHTARGMSWSASAPYHLASRAAAPAEGSPTVGFRCVRSVAGM